jgi:UDP-N-acetylmuramate dehydrogenase
LSANHQSKIETQKSKIETALMDRLLQDLHIPHHRDVPLGPLTWYGIGGKARILARPSSVQQLAALASRAHELKIPTYVLGGGANLLVADAGVEGLVIRLDDPCFQQVKIEGNIVTAGAGCDLFKLVPDLARAGLGGLEVLAGIPGTVGGAVRMNAGGIYGDIGKSVRRVQVMDGSGQVYYRDRDDLIFSYRKSNIAARYILEAEFELTIEGADYLMKRVKEVFAVKSNSQPLAANSAGCSFKNPPPAENGEKLAAGKLIDLAGLKGYRSGGAEISPIHANFVVAHPGCTAGDILAVMDHAQRTVEECFGIKLEREVVVWP